MRETADKDNLMDEKNELFDLNSEKQELDLFLASITGEEVLPSAAKDARAEIFTPATLSSGSKSKTEITDDKISTEKWEKTPFATDKTSSKDSQININKNWMKTATGLDDIHLSDKTIKIEREKSLTRLG